MQPLSDLMGLSSEVIVWDSSFLFLGSTFIYIATIIILCREQEACRKDEAGGRKREKSLLTGDEGKQRKQQEKTAGFIGPQYMADPQNIEGKVGGKAG